MVVLFARPREVLGAARVELELAEGATGDDAFARLAEGQPRLGPMKPMLRVAIDLEYAEWTTVLHDGAELALIPPTAGGWA
ncbi:MAG: MoaD/ThiS family protein [Candidatus Dormibacteria bacterium]